MNLISILLLVFKSCLRLAHTVLDVIEHQGPDSSWKIISSSKHSQNHTYVSPSMIEFPPPDPLAVKISILDEMRAVYLA